MKGNKGITLIALVITIIVLLILAGVSIAMLSGENSIFKKASDSSVATTMGAAKEAVIREAYGTIADYYEGTYVDGKTTTYTDVPAAVKAAASKATSEGVTIEVPSSGDNSGKIVITYKSKTGITSVGTVETDGKITWVDTGWNATTANSGSESGSGSGSTGN